MCVVFYGRAAAFAQRVVAQQLGEVLLVIGAPPRGGRGWGSGRNRGGGSGQDGVLRVNLRQPCRSAFGALLPAPDRRALAGLSVCARLGRSHALPHLADLRRDRAGHLLSAALWVAHGFAIRDQACEGRQGAHDAKRVGCGCDEGRGDQRSE